MPKEYEVIGECTDSYRVETLPDGGCRIYIVVSKRFSLLVRRKLTELKTNDQEIAFFEGGDITIPNENETEKT